VYCTQCGSPNADDARFCFHCGTPLPAAVAAAPPPVAVPPARTVGYAGFWRRFLAYVIDRLIVGIPLSIIIIAFMIPSIIAFCNRDWNGVNISVAIVSFVMSWVWLALLVVVAHLLYFIWFESSHFQATPGKMLLGIIVTDMQGQRVSVSRALGRNLGKILSHLILNIGFIMAGLTARKQALHDMLADCLVVMK
jgi:uncharacterized RDD family membrane protein YckC